MAQSATKRTPLGIDPFWDKPTPDPPLRWEKWRVQYKLALLAQENIILDTLLGPKPETVELPLEPIYEETIVGASAQSERVRKARNAQQKMNWQKKNANGSLKWVSCVATNRGHWRTAKLFPYST